MVKKTYIELMHKEIDGAIQADEREELQAYLKSNEKAARYYQELAKTANLLSQIPEVNPPEKLKDHILNSLDWRRYSVRGKTSSQNRFNWEWIFKPKFKLTYSFALGIVAGILIFALLLPFMNTSETLDTSDLYGTIGLDAKKGIEELQHIPIQLNEMTGDIYLRKFNGFIIFDIHLNSQFNSKLLLEYESSDYQFRGLQQNQPDGILFEKGNTFVNISNPQNAIYQIYFAKNNSKPAPIKLKILGPNEILLHQSIFVNP